MQRLLVLGCLLLTVGVVNAAPTTVNSTTPTSVSPADTFGYTHWVYEGNYTWTHSVSYGTAPVPGATLDLLSASLTITGYSIETAIGIKADGTSVGNLATAGPMDTTITTFVFPDNAALDTMLMDGKVVVQAIPTGDLGESFKFNSSKLSVTYDWILPPPEPPQPPEPPVVPAPAGLVLAGIGTALIGWLRRHQCL